MGVIDAKSRFLERRSQAALSEMPASIRCKPQQEKKPEKKVLLEDIHKDEDAKVLEPAAIAFLQDLNQRLRDNGFSGEPTHDRQRRGKDYNHLGDE